MGSKRHLIEDFIRLRTSTLTSELKVLADGVRDKGVKYFVRPLGVGGAIVFFSWYFAGIGKESLNRTTNELEAVRATTQYATDYQDLKNRLDLFYTRLPRTRQPGDWLLSEVRESLRLEGIVPNGYSSPALEVGVGYQIVSITVTLSPGFRPLVSWIARLESSKSLLHIKDLSLTKKAKPIGTNTVAVTVATIVPLQEGEQ